MEAYCKCPAPEACETAVLGRREPAELARAFLHQLESSGGLRAPATRQLERQGEESLFTVRVEVKGRVRVKARVRVKVIDGLIARAIRGGFILGK